MPELPDIVVYIEALKRRLLGETLEEVTLRSPFLLRTVEPELASFEGRRVVRLRRLGKRIALELEEELHLVFHLMVAGRFRWREGRGKPPGKSGLAAFRFSSGTLLLTEAGSKRRASLHAVRGSASLAAHDPGGLEVLESELEAFREALMRESHTLKRALTDARLFSGIGNAYSDEILHEARLSPVLLTRRLGDPEVERLFEAVRRVLRDWTERLRAEVGTGFPKKVTAFRQGMAVHGRYREPCPRCGSPVQRIRYADSETDYCAPCRTGGKLLADRALSRLLKSDWPRTLEELEALRRG